MDEREGREAQGVVVWQTRWYPEETRCLRASFLQQTYGIGVADFLPLALNVWDSQRCYLHLTHFGILRIVKYIDLGGAGYALKIIRGKFGHHTFTSARYYSIHPQILTDSLLEPAQARGRSRGGIRWCKLMLPRQIGTSGSLYVAGAAHA